MSIILRVKSAYSFLNSLEIDSAEGRVRKSKYIKELMKDVFDVLKNTLIIATLQLSAKATESFFLYLFSSILLIGLLVYTISIIFERLSFGIKTGNKITIRNWIIIIAAVLALTYIERYMVISLQELVVSKKPTAP